MGNAMLGDHACSSCACDMNRNPELHYPPTSERSIVPEESGKHSSGGAGAGCSDAPEINAAQAVVKSFVRNLVKGHVVTLLSVDGGIARCNAFLDRKLTTLSLQRGGARDSKKRAVPLENISEIIVGEDGGAQFNLATDHMSVTLALENGQGIAFSFADDEERDTFALCLTMFVDGRCVEVERHQDDVPGSDAHSAST